MTSTPRADAAAVAGGDGYPELFIIEHEKKPGDGEDASLAVFVGDTGLLIAVFDGMGGAGGQALALHSGHLRSMAWVAARLARDVVRDSNSVLQPQRAPEDAGVIARHVRFAHDLQARLASAFTVADGRLGGGSAGSGLRSRALKRLPTTMAAAYLERRADGAWACFSLWAGDSRIYLLTPAAGLQQITVDDLSSGADAFASISGDSQLTNYIAAGQPFTLHEYRIVLTAPPGIVLAATDGCFGYVASPAHFELLLLDAIAEAASYPQLEAALYRRVREHAGDDATLVGAAVGWDAYAGLRDSFAQRHAELSQSSVREREPDVLWAGYSRGYNALLPAQGELRRP